MLAVVQIVFTTWSKEFRGGPKAAERSRVPEALELPLPPAVPTGPAFLAHASEHIFGRVPCIRHLSASAVEVHPADEPFHAGCVWVRWDDDQLRVDYHWTPDAGMPERHTSRGVLNLMPGEWGRLRYNARISAYHTPAGWDCSDWWYEKWVFNIGLFTRFDPRAFLKTEPAKPHSQMELLR